MKMVQGIVLSVCENIDEDMLKDRETKYGQEHMVYYQPKLFRVSSSFN